MCLGKLFKLFKKSVEIGDEIDATELENWVAKLAPTATLSMLDRSYRLMPVDEVIQFLKADLTDWGIYVDEYKDCDDFAIQLWGLWKACYGKQFTSFGLALVGLATGGNHAVNIFIDENYEVWIIEPQTDGMWLLSEKDDWNPYLIIF